MKIEQSHPSSPKEIRTGGLRNHNQLRATKIHRHVVRLRRGEILSRDAELENRNGRCAEPCADRARQSRPYFARRTTANGWRVYQIPVWSERMKRPREELRGFSQTGTNLHNHLLSGCEEHVQRDFANRPSGKRSLESLAYVFQAGLQELMRWTIVAQNVCPKCLVESSIDTPWLLSIGPHERRPRKMRLDFVLL